MTLLMLLYNVVFYWLTHIQNDHWVVGINSNKWLLTAVWLKYFPWKHRHMKHTMMTLSNGTVFSVTGPLWGEFNGHRWIPLTKACEAEIWCFYDCTWTNDWANHGDAGSLRRHCAHYDVTVAKDIVTLVTLLSRNFPAAGSDGLMCTIGHIHSLMLFTLLYNWYVTRL